MKPIWITALMIPWLLLSGCQSADEASRATYMLIDVSGTYFRQLDACVRASKYALVKMKPNDFIAIAKISSKSFSDREVIIKGRLPKKPSQANAMKARMGSAIDQFAKKARASSYTDISGAIYQAAQVLHQQPSQQKRLVIFSDLVEDLSLDIIRERLPSLEGIDVIAANVIKLRSDNRNPEKYFRRLQQWEHMILKAGAKSWRVVDDPMQLADYL